VITSNDAGGAAQAPPAFQNARGIWTEQGSLALAGPKLANIRSIRHALLSCL
jgi:hypothetical protein